MNPGYWLGRYEVVKAWRQLHPDYQRDWRRWEKERQSRRALGEIQAERFSKALDAVQKNVFLLREIQAEIPLQLLNIHRKFPGYACRPA